MTKLEFLKGLKYLTALYMKDMSEEEIENWYLKFSNIDSQVFYKTINNLKNKFMPNAIELLELCEQTEKNITYEILDKMKDDGYFKYGVCGELPLEQQTRNYEKATKFVSSGIIPEWLLEDMMKYGYKKQLPNNGLKLIGE